MMALRLRVDVAAAVVGVAASGLLLLGSSLPVSGQSVLSWNRGANALKR